MTDDLLEAWHTNNRMNLFLVEHISEEGLRCTLSRHGGRDVAGQLAHIHNNRVWQLQTRARDLSEGLVVFETKVSPPRAELADALSASANAVAAFLEAVQAREPKRRGFKKGIFTTLSYFVAHESHHRGNILLTLKTSGHKLDKDASYAMWNWDKM
jgi:uncharacterized damage-inducible protein DinB